MKIESKKIIRRSLSGLGATRRGENGMATFVFIVLLAIMMILVTAESRALFQLHREVKFLEQRQNQRLNLSQTNAATVVASTKTPEAK